MTTIKESHNSSEEYAIIVIGRKGRDYLQTTEKLPLIDELPDCRIHLHLLILNPLLHAAVQALKLGEYDELYICYNRFINAMTQVPR